MRLLVSLLLAGTLLLPVTAQQLKIDSRPFHGRTVSEDSGTLVELEKFAAELGLPVTKNEDGSYSLGSLPATLPGPNKITIGAQVVDLHEKDGVAFVLLEDLVGPCGLKIDRADETGIVDIRSVTASVAPPPEAVVETVAPPLESPNSYENAHLGISLTVPDGFLLVKNTEVLEQLHQLGSKDVGTPEGREVMKRSAAGLQFSVINSRPGRHAGSSLTLVTEPLNGAQIGMKDYAQLNKKNLPKLIRGVKILRSKKATQVIDGVEFAVMDFQFPTAVGKMRSRILLTVDSKRELGYAFGLTGKTEADLKELEKLLARLKLQISQGSAG